MTTTISSRLAKLLISIICLAVILPSIALAEIAGKLTKVSGRVDILHAGTTVAVPAVLNEDISIGDILRTKSDGIAEITFVDDSIMAIGPKSRLGIEEYLYKSEENKRVASLKLHRGRAAFTVPKPVYAAVGSKFEMHTKTAVAGVRGTEGLLLTGPVERVYVSIGIVEFRNPLGLVIVTAGNVGEIFYGRAPIVRPYSGTEFKNQEQGVKGGKPASAASSPPAQTTASQLAVTTTPPNVVSSSVTPLPLSAIDATGKASVPSTSSVTINPIFPGTTTGTATGSTTNINVR